MGLSEIGRAWIHGLVTIFSYSSIAILGIYIIFGAPHFSTPRFTHLRWTVMRTIIVFRNPWEFLYIKLGKWLTLLWIWSTIYSEIRHQKVAASQKIRLPKKRNWIQHGPLRWKPPTGHFCYKANLWIQVELLSILKENQLMGRCHDEHSGFVFVEPKSSGKCLKSWVKDQQTYPLVN